MESFDDLGLQPALVEALAAEGIERPTALQREVIPVLRRATSAAIEAAPGSGLLVAYGAPLLDRLEPGRGQPSTIVLTAARERGHMLARSLARLAVSTGHQVGALAGSWTRPEEADILFSTPKDLEAAVRASLVKLDQVEALVLEGAGSLLDESSEALDTVLSVTAEVRQVVVVAETFTPAVRRWVEDHARRAVFIPPETSRGESLPSLATRGTIRVLASSEDSTEVVPVIVSQLLREGHDHVLVYARTTDAAADLGDELSLYGFTVGRPGEPEAPVWLGVDPLEAREMIAASSSGTSTAAVLSTDPPADADELDRRHGGGFPAGVVVAPPRALPHLRRIAQEAGYVVEREASSDRPPPDELQTFYASVEGALDQEDLVPYLLLLEPLMRRTSAPEVAAALAALLRKKVALSGETRGGAPAGGTTSPAPTRPPAWTKLFLGVGLKDGIGAGDLLGAILGEAKVEREQVGKIELKETFSRVEVHDSVADRVIRALNGTSIRGRSVRADFDRGEGRPSGGSGGAAGAAGRGGVGRRGAPGRGGTRRPK